MNAAVFDRRIHTAQAAFFRAKRATDCALRAEWGRFAP
jgi:hypothetical protein